MKKRDAGAANCRDSLPTIVIIIIIYQIYQFILLHEFK